MFWDFIYQFNNSFGWEWLSNVCIFKTKIKEERKNKAIAYTFSFFKLFYEKCSKTQGILSFHCNENN